VYLANVLKSLIRELSVTEIKGGAAIAAPPQKFLFSERILP
jgi:hypothetical protein